jgi:hypothetical protein
VFPSSFSLQRIRVGAVLKFIRVKMNNDRVDLAATVKGRGQWSMVREEE